MDAADLHTLATLDALLQTGSVTSAATRLGLSTPAISHALARLHERLGDPLLGRAGRGMILTPRAEALRDKTHAALLAAAEVFQAPDAFDPSPPAKAASAAARLPPDTP
jgi:DNA-binding transcriptional LysR family regulator